MKIRPTTSSMTPSSCLSKACPGLGICDWEILTAFIQLNGDLHSGCFGVDVLLEMITVFRQIEQLVHFIDIGVWNLAQRQSLVVLILPNQFLGTLMKALRIKGFLAITHCSKSSFFCLKIQLWFPEKSCPIVLGEKLVEMLRFWTF